MWKLSKELIFLSIGVALDIMASKEAGIWSHRWLIKGPWELAKILGMAFASQRHRIRGHTVFCRSQVFGNSADIWIPHD